MNIWTRHRQLKSSWGTFPLTASYEKQSAHQNVRNQVSWEKNKQKNNFVAIFFFFFKKRDVAVWSYSFFTFYASEVNNYSCKAADKAGGKHLKWLFTIRRKWWLTLRCCKYGYRKESVSVCCNHRQERERVRQIGTPFLLICYSTSSTHNSSKGGE